MYHHISDIPPLAYSQVDLTVTSHDFAAQLAYLTGHGYHAVTLVDLFNRLYYGRALPPRPVVLTFDDGYADNYSDAFPLLRRYHMVGEFNIVTGLVGTTLGVNTYVTWPQVEAMAAAGWDAGRAAEVAELLALGLTRLMARKSSEFSPHTGESSLHSSPAQSGDGPVSEKEERA